MAFEIIKLTYLLTNLIAENNACMCKDCRPKVIVTHKNHFDNHETSGIDMIYIALPSMKVTAADPT